MDSRVKVSIEITCEEGARSRTEELLFEEGEDTFHEALACILYPVVRSMFTEPEDMDSFVTRFRNALDFQWDQGEMRAYRAANVFSDGGWMSGGPVNREEGSDDGVHGDK